MADEVLEGHAGGVTFVDSQGGAEVDGIARTTGGHSGNQDVTITIVVRLRRLLRKPITATLIRSTADWRVNQVTGEAVAINTVEKLEAYKKYSL